MKKRGKTKSRANKTQRQHQPRGPKTAFARAGHDGAALDIHRLPPADRALGARAVVMTPAYEADERQALALLLLPFLIIALSLGLSHTLKPVMSTLIEASRPMPAMVEAVRAPGGIAFAPLSMPVAVPVTLRAPERIQLTTPLALPITVPVALKAPAPIIPTTPLQLPRQAPEFASPALARFIVPAPPITLPLVPPAMSAFAATSMIVPTPTISLPSTPPDITAPAPVAAIDSAVCLPAPKRVALNSPPAATEFGVQLAHAAQAQTGEFVIYSATYKRIAYPMGDVPSLYGACSDLVIRAYRALGIDLQDLVQRARVGRGDPNIDHRRTDTLRLFFSRFGEAISPSNFAEDYRPGDIVTYYRPYSRVSRAHIAIVSDVIGPSGKPMIVHNRGWGPQLEDALFVDQITGHYRFTGAPQLQATHGRIAASPAKEARPVGKPALPKTASAAPGHGRSTDRDRQFR